MKRCSTSLIIREMQIQTTMRYHLMQVRMATTKSLQTINAGKGKETSYPLELPERMRPCWQFNFSSVKLIADFLWLPEFKHNKFMLFNTSQFLMIWYNSNRNLRQRVHMKLLYNGFWQKSDIPWILILLILILFF